MRATLAAETKLRETLEAELAEERDKRQREHTSATSSTTALEEVNGWHRWVAQD